MTDLPRPSKFELAILRVLWSRETATVRQIFEELQKERPLGYTTVLKTILIMLEKGLVVRDESERSHIYRATQKEQETQASLLHDLVHRAFGGSAQKLVMAAIKEGALSLKEEVEIKALLEASRKMRGK
ncbi:MAG: BlaI/MecI/CopY family transcriptional regulator [Holophagaceae bacterium]|nr:BlaI/MecI/CopY family transcriptional regulator [Holophagaceae bacterium]